jgi:hypothetical protein
MLKLNFIYSKPKVAECAIQSEIHLWTQQSLNNIQSQISELKKKFIEQEQNLLFRRFGEVCASYKYNMTTIRN